MTRIILLNNIYSVVLERSCSRDSVVRTLGDQEPKSTPTRTSIQIGPSLHVEDSVGKYINHACNPTCKVEGANVVALKDLDKGAEITFNYNENEDRLASPFKCGCCGNEIRGRKCQIEA